MFHHLFAVRDLGIEEIDCPVKPVDDFNMIRMMAEENLSLWSATPGAANEAVWAAKNKLDDVLDQFETLDEFMGSTAKNFERYQRIFEGYDKQDFTKVRDQGAGQRPLIRFLGDSWTGTINAALSALAEDAARAHAARLARRAERAKAKEEAAKLEAQRKA